MSNARAEWCYLIGMLGGATFTEISFAAVLVVLVLMAPIVPRVGAAVGKLFEKSDPKGPA